MIKAQFINVNCLNDNYISSGNTMAVTQELQNTSHNCVIMFGPLGVMLQLEFFISSKQDLVYWEILNLSPPGTDIILLVFYKTNIM